MTVTPATAVAEKPRRPLSRFRSIRGRETWAGLAMIAPAGILLVLFLVIPVLLAFGLSFTNARLISLNPPRFVGLDNFARAFGADPMFLQSAWNTFLFALVVVPVQAGLGLLLAVLVNRRMRGVTAFRVIFFIPVVTSIVVVSILWKFMYQKDGLINSFIDALTFGAWQSVDWLNNPSTALPAIIVLSIWQAVGFHMIIWLSGLQTIPEELYEAAKMDGASTITIAALGLFVQVDVMTQGGPTGATSTIVYHAVRKGYQQQEIGYAAAISLIFFVAVLIIALIQRRLTRDKD